MPYLGGKHFIYMTIYFIEKGNKILFHKCLIVFSTYSIQHPLGIMGPQYQQQTKHAKLYTLLDEVEVSHF
jgi:hypothetical protein